jgi:nitrogen regulatory protein PII 2
MLMKEVITIVRPEMWRATQDAIYAVGIADLIHWHVKGRGKQRGLRRSARPLAPGDGDVSLLPKRIVICFVPDEKVAELVQTIIRVNRAGNYGDGKIFVRPLVGARSIEIRMGAVAGMAAS